MTLGSTLGVVTFQMRITFIILVPVLFHSVGISSVPALSVNLRSEIWNRAVYACKTLDIS
jgi:hypothetical protein